MDKQGEFLTVLAAPNLSQAAVKTLNATVPGVGNRSCANALVNKEPTFISDVTAGSCSGNSHIHNTAAF